MASLAGVLAAKNREREFNFKKEQAAFKKEALDKGLDAMFNSRMSELKRQSIVQSKTATIDDDTAQTELQSMLNIKDPVAQRSYMQLQMNQKYSRQAIEALQQQQFAQKSVNDSLRFELDKQTNTNKTVANYVDGMFDDNNTTAALNTLKVQTGTVYKALLNSNNPEIRSNLSETLELLGEKTGKAQEDLRNEQTKEKTKIKQVGLAANFTSADIERMPVGTRGRLARAERLGEDADIRGLTKGSFPGGTVGWNPWDDKEVLMDYTDAMAEGFTQEEWDAQAPKKPPTTAKESVKESISKKKESKTSKRSRPKDVPANFIHVRDTETDKVGWIDPIEFKASKNKFEAVK